MNAPVDVFIAAAGEDAETARALAGALSTRGITAVASTVDLPASEMVSSLDPAVRWCWCCRPPPMHRWSWSGYSSVRLGAASRSSPYAIENVSPSPSISYFSATVPPIVAWGTGDSDRPIRTLVEAATRALTVSPQRARPAPRRRSASASTYRDSRGLERAVAGVLTILASFSAYALYRDVDSVLKHRLGPQGTSPVAAADLGLSQIVSGLGVWCVIVCAIVCFSRARTNLLALFVTTVQVSGRDRLAADGAVRERRVASANLQRAVAGQ